MENEFELLVAENQISFDFDALQEEEEQSSSIPESLIRPVNTDWIKDEVLYVAVRAYNDSVVANMPDHLLCGKKLIDWVTNAGGDCEKKVIEDSQNIFDRLRSMNTQKDIIAVFYSDTPLLDRATFHDVCNYFSSHHMNFLQLPRGFVIRTEYLRNVTDYAQGKAAYENKNLMIADSARILAFMASFLYNKILSFHIKNGVIIYGQNTVFIDADVEIDSGVVIYPNNVISGQSIVASGTILRSGNIISDSIIAGNTTLENCFVSNSKISQGKAVQPCSQIVNEEL